MYANVYVNVAKCMQKYAQNFRLIASHPAGHVFDGLVIGCGEKSVQRVTNIRAPPFAHSHLACCLVRDRLEALCTKYFLILLFFTRES